MFLDRQYQIGKMKKSYPDIHNLLVMWELFDISH